MTDLATLERKLHVLQTSHDYIEQNGFIIRVYEGSALRDGEAPPRCYIGTVRGAAGVRPEPRQGIIGPAHEDDGPELELALIALDQAVKEADEYSQHQDGILPYIEKENRGITEYPGRFVEAVGLFLARDEVEGEDDWEDIEPIMQEDEQEQFALRLFRKAICTTVAEIEAIKA